MHNKLRVFVSLHHRGQLSLAYNREQLGSAAYHWGILISPKRWYKGEECYYFDVTDSACPVLNRVDQNPGHMWYFRANTDLDPTTDAQLLGKVMIGKISRNVPTRQSEPVSNRFHFRRGFHWNRNAGFADEFDGNQFMEDSLAWVDMRLKNIEPTGNTLNYTKRPM
ncbi:hypothetical protein FE257_001774 [Aspergillus nanangensis]|uniref:Uncharacterized protein n=1 Tax=Aspergillus nanangensis TaxID=2582783 RepID=A0AAD4GQJ5_ASPNN|nr:hypothetical protein FE257_001774 [Aspergillus nanangensis]